MNASVSFYAVRKSDLDGAPEAVRKFVKNFFKPRDIFGADCFVILRCSTCQTPWADTLEEEYAEGLSQEDLQNGGVLDWMSRHLEMFSHFQPA